MRAGAEKRLARVLARLAEEKAARLAPEGEGGFALVGPRGAEGRVDGNLARAALAAGLLVRDRAGGLRPAPAAEAWLKRREAEDAPFLEQHVLLAKGRSGALLDLDESPVGQLARRRGADGKPFLDAAAIAAAERLRSDFERGRMQPRVTANWSAPVARGRRSGEEGGVAELTQAALSARRRVERAVEAVGPELSGVLLDVCCFLKGLEAVEGERGWPARSAKLVLRLALAALARHYGLSAEATGGPGSGRIAHWGAVDYRPKIS